MHKLYQKNEIGFAILWILLYLILTGFFEEGSILLLFVLVAIAVGITLFIKKHHLEEKYGLQGWPKDSKRYLYFIPLWILVTGNLWGGCLHSYAWPAQAWCVLSMLLVGYIEEILFRGFLFWGIEKHGIKKAILISALTFGLGHILNLFTGQATLETIIQVLFSLALGFIFTAIVYKSKSLFPCIVAHGLIDTFAEFGRENITIQWVYMIATILVAVVYCTYLFKLPKEKRSK